MSNIPQHPTGESSPAPVPKSWKVTHPSAGRTVASACNGSGTLPPSPEKELVSGNSSVPAMEPLKLLPDPEVPLPSPLERLFRCYLIFLF